MVRGKTKDEPQAKSSGYELKESVQSGHQNRSQFNSSSFPEV